MKTFFSMLLVGLVSSLPAVAQNNLSWRAGLEYSRYSGQSWDADSWRLNLSADYEISTDLELRAGLSYARSKAFGLDFGATSLYVEPRYSVSSQLTLGAYLRYATTDNPANLEPTTGIGLTAEYELPNITLSGYYGFLAGSDVDDPGDNTSLGLGAGVAVGDYTSLFVRYERDHWGFRNQQVGGLDIGIRHSFMGNGSRPDVDAELSLGRFVVNNNEYDRVSLAVSIPFGTTKEEKRAVDFAPYSASLRVPYSF